MSAEQDAVPYGREVSGHRRLLVTPASDISIRPVKWLWEDRIPAASLSLLGGREGTGKSTLALSLVADITQGRLPGCFSGEPQNVMVVATEDSWEHTIVPRLMACGADLARVLRMSVATSSQASTGLSLPTDMAEMEARVRDAGAAMVVLDPLLSRLDSTLDTHKDAEVRLALEPLTGVSERTGATVLGLIHVNKSLSRDPLTLLMGSRAFVAVARSVLFLMQDPDDEARRLLGQAKNNLGRIDLPTLLLQIESTVVGRVSEGEVFGSRVRWGGSASRSIHEAIGASENGATTTAVGEGAAWLRSFLADRGGSAPSREIAAAGVRAGYSESTLKRARSRIGATSASAGFPRHTTWNLPREPGDYGYAGESAPTEPTGLTVVARNQLDQSAQETQPSKTAALELDPLVCSINCGNYRAHQLWHRRVGNAWVCDVCELAVAVAH